jgi:uncharacterized protein YbjT (DUF2867 family)/DNA-binding SARP family transcriptional activator
MPPASAATPGLAQPTATVRLLGRFSLRVVSGDRDDGGDRGSGSGGGGGETEVRVDMARAELLVAFLALHPGAQSRKRLAAVLWPDSTEAQAHTNLRKLLHTVRHRLPAADCHLEITPRTVRWRGESDVAEFERLLTSDLGRAVALYGGDLLDGHDAAWLEPERQRLRGRWLDAMADLADRCAADGALTDATAAAERLLRADPLREENYRRLMRLYAERGDPARALGVYHECAAVWERELGVRPSAATRAVYAALLPRETCHREAVAAPAALVGRAAERRQLVDLFRAADAGRTQFVLLTGEAGIGKTRLVEDFRTWCARQGAVVAEARCHSAEGPLVYGPVTAWLRSGALRPRLAHLDPERRSELARLLPELLVEGPDTPKPAPISADEHRLRLLDAVAEAVLAAPATRVLVLDDLQHVDRETCRLVHYLLRRDPTARLLVAATARREDIDRDHPAWELLAGLHALDRCVEIELARLDRAETALLARELGRTLIDAERLYAETEGNPLFVVEALRLGANAPVSRRVQTVLEARLAQLSAPARALAEVAATIGHEFRVDVLAAAAGIADDVLLDGLDELWRRRILREQEAQAYRFSHDKLREVAALGVSPPRRRLLHLRIAPALERAHAADPGPVSAQIAGHYAEGGSATHAAIWYRRAAETAQELHASGAAVDLLERAVRQVRTLPPSRSRDAAELELQNAVLGPLASAAGYVGPAIAAHQQEALRLSATLGVAEAPPLLRSLGMSALTAEDFPATLRIGAQLQAAGEHLGEPVLVVEGAYLLGMAAFWQTDFAAARTHLETAVARYRPADLPTHLVRYGQDPKVTCLSRLGNTLWFLGRPDAARRARDAALAWAGHIAQPFSTGIALLFGAVLALDMDDEPALRELTARLAATAPKPPPLQLAADALAGHLAVLDGKAGLPAIDAAVHAAQLQSPAPGVPAILARIRLAAAVATGNPAQARAAADALLTMGGAAAVWAPQARRVAAAFPEAPPRERPGNAARRTVGAMSTILAIGATGTVGRHLVPQLVDRGLPVRALVRNPAADLPAAVDRVVGDLADPASLAPALEGIEAVYLACGNHPAQATWETTLIDAAATAGVRRIVKLSTSDVAIGSPVAFADAHGRIEAHLRASGIDHVLLRPTFLMSNLLATADGVRQAGAIFLPGAGAKIAMTDPRDVADVAAVALTTPVSPILELTGPSAVTFDDVAAELSAVTGRRIGFVPVPDDAAVGQLVAAGAPEWFATNLVAVFGLLRQGVQAQTRDTVHAVLGREPRSVAAFLRDHAAVFAESR